MRIFVLSFTLNVTAARRSEQIFLVMGFYSVFYLVGGSANFVCQSMIGKFSWEKAQEEVADIKKMGYKAMAVKDGHIIGGYCSYTDFSSKEEAAEYYHSV